jgi:4-amino-4-deoxy-L-arabinose transferase-like glycosyltransferase
MSSTLTRDRLLVLAAALVMFFTGLGTTRLWDEDEGFFAATAAEMHHRNEWIVPWYNGEVFAHKPPLMYWVMRLGFYVFGENEWGARIGSAIFGTAAALLTHWLGTRLLGARVGLLAGLAMASCIMFGVVSRASTADAYLVFFMTLVIAAYVRWTPAFGVEQPSTESTDPLSLARWLPATWFGFVAMYAAMGLAVLVKGPIGILLPGTAIGLFVLWQLSHAEATWSGWLTRFVVHIPRVFWALRPLTAIATVVVVSGWWFAAVEARTGGGFLGEFLGFHNIQRFLAPMEKHSGPIVYYIPVIWIGFFPWSLFIVPSAITVRSRLKQSAENKTPAREQAAWRLVLCWFSVILVFFSIAQTKLPNYTLPCYPPLALLVAGFVSRWLSEPTVNLQFWSRWAFGSLVVVGVCFLVFVPLVALMQVDGAPLLVKAELHPVIARELWPLALVGLPALIGGVLCWRFAERGQPVLMLRTFAVTAVVFCLGILGGAAAYLDQYQSSESLADACRSRSTSDSMRMASYHLSSPSLIFYAKQPVVQVTKPEEIERHLSQPGSFLFTSADNWGKLSPEVQAGLVKVYERTAFPKPGTVLVLQRKTTDAVAQQPETAPR